MKIVQVLGGNEDGGLEKHVIELSAKLVEKGLKVFVIAHEDFRDDFEKNSVSFVPLDLTKSRNNPFVLYKLLKIISKISPDIVHSQANKATAMIATIKPFLKCLTVATLHNDKRNLKPFEKVDFVITVSDFIAKNLKNKYRKTIYNGINLEHKRVNKPCGLPQNKFILCSVARFTKVKRLELIFEAIQNLDVHFALVGDGEEREKLETLAQKLNIKNKITFFGFLEPKEAYEIVSQSSLFVLCSNKEGFPYTFVESMLLKTPFLSTPVSDIPNFLDKKYIFDFENSKDMEEKIVYVKENYDIVLDDFKPIFELAGKKFTIENMVNENIEVYKKILGFQK